MTYPERATERSQAVLCWREDGIGHIRFNRPSAFNAVDLAMAQAFAQACEQVGDDPSVRVVVVSGEGRAFLAGGDVQAMRADPSGATASLVGLMHQGVERLAGLHAPVIASLHGMVAGGGIGIALACDLAVAAQGTRFNFAYPAIGASADCGVTWSLPRCVGQRRSLEIALLAQPFDADEALRLGLVNRVVAAECLQDETQALARRLATSAPLALAALKRLIRGSGQTDLPGQLRAEAQAFAACAASADFAEGLDALVGKRQPRFTGA